MVLEQISGLIDEDVSVKMMREMLQHKQVELEARLKAEQKRLEMVAAQLLQIEQAGGRAGSDVLVKKVSTLLVAILHEVVSTIAQLPDRVNALVDELNNWWRAQPSSRMDPGWHFILPPNTANATSRLSWQSP